MSETQHIHPHIHPQLPKMLIYSSFSNPMEVYRVHYVEIQVDTQEGRGAGQKAGAHSPPALWSGGRRCLQIPADPLRPCAPSAGAASCSVKTALPQPECQEAKQNLNHQKRRIKTHLAGSRASELLVSEMGLIRSLGGAARWEVCVPNTAN